MAHRIGIEVAEVNGNHERNTAKPLSGSRITRNEAITNNKGRNISALLPELFGSVITDAIAAIIAFHIRIPVRAKGKNNSMEGRYR